MVRSLIKLTYSSKFTDYFFDCQRIQTQYNNAFSGFDVFRNLPFEVEQVELFIRRWFGEDNRDRP